MKREKADYVKFTPDDFVVERRIEEERLAQVLRQRGADDLIAEAADTITKLRLSLREILEISGGGRGIWKP